MREDAAALQPALELLRQELHRTPEIGLDLPLTQAIVLRELEGLGLEVCTGVETTSVTAVLRGGRRDAAEPRTVLLRGDMDALPIVEETGLPFAADNGAMHACGHDIHTAALVGAARLLAARRDELHGDVVFMFQPGEEGYDGAGVMIREGVLDAAGRRADAAYAMHVMAWQLPLGVFSCRPGTTSSSSSTLTVRVLGQGGHGSRPYRAKDPITAAAHMIVALQTTVTRHFDIWDPVVLTVGQIHGGTKDNVIPPHVDFQATVRTHSTAALDKLDRLVHACLTGTAAAHEVEVDIDFDRRYPVSYNEPDEAAFSADVVRDVLGDDAFQTLPNPSAGSEDFSRVLAEVPGCYLFYGGLLPGRDPETVPMNHSPFADFDPSVLSRAALVYAELAARRLRRFAEEG
ncbi:M20 metallopeptidase family protein [Microbacterium sp. No. 7]|uniref:M20 metallopeptidase family protein n=1 Tax=Microbacterium sp. No. 7 TaxID=1714373 RepID=UPI001E4D576B|nr:M20 family metallopeptidase [Microbacterium sp. No. 7]